MVAVAADPPPAKPAATDSSAAKPKAALSATELAKQTQNPVADLISVPFQFNTYFETGPLGRTQNVLVIQPVIPIHLNEDWNFIARPIIPIIDSAPMFEGQDRNTGLGDIQFEGFFVPKAKVLGDWTLGIGPVMQFPTNTGPDGRYGNDNWAAGPALLLMQGKGHWVFGGLFTQLWSYAGSDDEINESNFQPFVNYNLKDGWYLHSDPTFKYNWSADSSEAWTVPVGGGLGKVVKIGKMPVNLRLASYYFAEAPRTGSDWQLQFQVQLLFPE
jgi:hypothetical protein